MIAKRTLLFANLYPQQCSGLVFISPPTMVIEREQPIIDGINNELADVAETGGMLAALEHSASERASFFARWLSVTATKNPANREVILNTPREQFCSAMRRFANWNLESDPQDPSLTRLPFAQLSDGELAAMDLSTLIVPGHEDEDGGLHPRSTGEHLAYSMPNATLAEQDEGTAGSLDISSRLEPVAQEIERFLEKHH